NFMRKHAAALFAHGKTAKDQLIKQGYEDKKIYPVMHGDYAFFTNWSVDSIEQAPNILFFGRIEPYKGLDILLESMQKVWKDHPDWTLTVAGVGDISPYSANLADKRIELINRFIEDEEVAPLFQKASFVVLPYISATQSGVIPVASAFKKPV